MRKLLKYISILLVVLFLTIILVPYLFKDELIALVKKEVNANLKGEFVIGDGDVSLIRNFPQLSLTLNDCAFKGEDVFSNDTLFSLSKLRLNIDLLSAFSGSSFNIEGILIDQPNIKILVTEEGVANYDIVKESTSAEAEESTSGESSGFVLMLQKFEIRDMTMTYNDKASQLFFGVEDLNHLLSGDFSEEVVNIKTETDFNAATFKMEGVKYLNKVKGESDFDLAFNSKTNTLNFGENHLTLNRLKLAFNGGLTLLENGYDLDLNFNTPNTDFAELLSLIPSIYKSDMESITARGKFALNGSVKGKYLESSEDYPAFKTNLTVEDGYFAHSQSEIPLEKTAIDFVVNHPGGDLDKMKLDLNSFTMEVAQNPFEAVMHIKNPMTDPHVDGKANGMLDLASVKDMLQLEEELSGRLFTDIQLNGRVSSFEKGDMNNAHASGNLSLSHMAWNSKEYNIPVHVDTLYSEIQPNKIDLPITQMTVGKSDLSLSGEVTNAMAYYFNDAVLSGNVKLTSSKVDLNEFNHWMQSEDGEAAAEATEEEALEVVRVPKNIDFLSSVYVTELIYGTSTFNNVNGKLNIKDGKVDLSPVKLGYHGGVLALNGSYDSNPVKPLSTLDFSIKELPFSEAAGSLDIIKKYIPIADNILGYLNTNFKLSTALNEDMMPDYSTLTASGLLKTAGLSYTSQALQNLNTVIPNNNLSAVTFGNTNLSFELENGVATIKPVAVKLGGQEFAFSGTHTLDQKIDYALEGDLPLDGLNLPKELEALGLTASSIELKVNIDGTMDNPKFHPTFGDYEVAKVVEQLKEEVLDTVAKVVTKSADKILADAKAQSDAILAQAQQQVNTLKAEADKQAKYLRTEADKLAKQLVDEAKGNPLQEIAAKAAADRALKEANKQIDEVLKVADEEGAKIMADAQKKSDEILKEADEKAKGLAK